MCYISNLTSHISTHTSSHTSSHITHITHHTSHHTYPAQQYQTLPHVCSGDLHNVWRHLWGDFEINKHLHKYTCTNTHAQIHMHTTFTCTCSSKKQIQHTQQNHTKHTQLNSHQIYMTTNTYQRIALFVS